MKNMHYRFFLNKRNPGPNSARRVRSHRSGTKGGGLPWSFRSDSLSWPITKRVSRAVPDVCKIYICVASLVFRHSASAMWNWRLPVDCYSSSGSVIAWIQSERSFRFRDISPVSQHVYNSIYAFPWWLNINLRHITVTLYIQNHALHFFFFF